MILRCKGTGNPCGTDTWTVGQECDCGNCQAWLARFRESPAADAAPMLALLRNIVAMCDDAIASNWPANAAIAEIRKVAQGALNLKGKD